MKTRIIALSALAVAAVAFVGCNKIEQTVDALEKAGIPFEFIASGIDIKTTNDGLHTNWKSGDQVNLFHAVAGSTTYIAETSAFVASSDGAGVTFSGTLNGELTEDNYDWYAIYPYSSYITTPASTSSGYITFGSAYNAKQKQTGNSNMTHIAGSKYPVAGKALNVAKDTKPVITMSHLTTVIAVKVTNGLTSPITVSEVSFTGTEKINGTFYVDFVSNPVVYTKSDDEHTSNTATLQVASGTSIAAGANATFYLAVKPFEAPASSTLSVSVTASNGTQVFNKVIGSAANFLAGKINTLNVEYNKELVLNLPFEDDMSWADNGATDGTTLLTASDFPVDGSSNPLYSTVTNGYKGIGGIKLGKSAERGDITTVNLDLSSAFTIIVSAMTWGSDESVLQVFVDGTQVGVDATLYNEYVEYVYKPGAKTAASNVKVKIDGKRGYVNSIRIIDGETYTAKPVIHLTSTPAALTADAGSSSIGYVVLNPTSGSVSAAKAADWITTFDYSVANTIGFTYTANTGDTRSQNVTLSYTGADNKIVNVTQNSNVTTDTFSWDLTTDSYVKDPAPTDDLIQWTHSVATMANAKGTGTKVNNYIPTTRSSTRFYNGNILTITPASGQNIVSVTFTATSDSYATALRNSTWTNATAAGSGTSVVVTPTNGANVFSAAVGGTCGVTKVTVEYVVIP